MIFRLISKLVKGLFSFILLIIFLTIVLAILAVYPISHSDNVTYGVSFSRFHSDELELDWKETYLAIVEDLGVRHFRFSAHWPLTEPENDSYNFEELDFQMSTAERVGADAIIAIGRRLPGWPECHDPQWIENISKEERKKEILELITKVVERYKDSPALLYWQVENEPYLVFFSKHTCGDADFDFLKEEIALVRTLDPDHPILLTDSGELSVWYGAYKNGDVFGTSMYLYIWNHTVGKLKYPIGPWFFNIKQNVMRLLVGDKPTIVIELSAEPWLLQPLIKTPLDIQLGRMDAEKLSEMLAFANGTSFDTFYLWGAEWWYWMQKNGDTEIWDMMRDIFAQ